MTEASVTRTRNGLPLAALALTALLAGCRSYTPNRLTVFAPGHGGDAKVEVLNAGLHDDVELAKGHALFEDQIMVAIVTVKNHVDDDEHVDFRWTWFDADGVEQRTGGTFWDQVFLKAQEEKQLVGKAPQPGAVRVQLDLRYHRDIQDR